MAPPSVALDPAGSWRFIGTSFITHRKHGPRFCISRVVTVQPPFFTLCRGQRTVRAEELLLAVNPAVICRECLREAMRRRDFPLAAECAETYHQHQKGVTP